MAARSTTNQADEAADAINAAGKRTGASARRAGEDVGDAIDRTTGSGAAKVRRAARRSVDAYDATTDEFDQQVGSIEDAIRRNPLAAAGAALLVGAILGRFIL